MIDPLLSLSVFPFFFLLLFAFFQIHAASCKTDMQKLEVYLFWAAVVVYHGGCKGVDLLTMWIQIIIIGGLRFFKI